MLPVSKLTQLSKEVKAGNKLLEGVSLTEKELEILTNAGYFDAVVKPEINGEVLGKKASGAVDDIIKDGSHLNDGKLKPNTKYQTGEHGYNYQTNSNGVIEHASTDNLQFKTHEGRLPHNPKTPDKLSGDHAGHLFGDRFGGSGDLDNLVSQAQKVNLSSYKKLENTWAKAIEQGKKVIVDIHVNYDSGSLRPVSFDVIYTIDGIDFYEFIHN